MQKKYWISLGFLTAILIATFLLLNASTPQEQKVICCKKVSKDCPSDIKTGVPGQTNLENLSHRFIFISSAFN